jgi:LL-diaminopimelate aminotransferase
VPKTLEVSQSSGKPVNLHAMWLRRQSTKFNGVPYVVQKAAASLYTETGQSQIKGLIDIYLKNAGIIKKAFEEKGYTAWGADNSPYIWLKVPDGMTSWDFFDYLLEHLSYRRNAWLRLWHHGRGLFPSHRLWQPRKDP